MTAPCALAPAVAEWDALRAVPGGAALIDAFLNLRQELQSMVVQGQMMDSTVGMTPAAMREYANALIPLLELGRGRDWTEEYEAMRVALFRAMWPIQKYVRDLEQGYRHDWLVRDALKILEQAQPPMQRLPLHYSKPPGCGQCGGTGGLHLPGCIALASSGEF